MPDTRNLPQTRETARDAASQTEEAGRRVVDASTENTRRTAEAGAASVRSAVKTQCHQDKVLLRRPLNIQSGFVSI